MQVRLPQLLLFNFVAGAAAAAAAVAAAVAVYVASAPALGRCHAPPSPFALLLL